MPASTAVDELVDRGWVSAAPDPAPLTQAEYVETVRVLATMAGNLGG